MSEPKITATEQSVTVKRYYRVDEAPPQTKRYSSTVTYSPTNVTLEWRDGRFVHAEVSGDRLGKKGVPTGTRAGESLWDASMRPEWLNQLIESESAGVRAQQGWR